MISAVTASKSVSTTTLLTMTSASTTLKPKPGTDPNFPSLSCTQKELKSICFARFNNNNNNKNKNNNNNNNKNNNNNNKKKNNNNQLYFLWVALDSIKF